MGKYETRVLRACSVANIFRYKRSIPYRDARKNCNQTTTESSVGAAVFRITSPVCAISRESIYKIAFPLLTKCFLSRFEYRSALGDGLKRVEALLQFSWRGLSRHCYNALFMLPFISVPRIRVSRNAPVSPLPSPIHTHTHNGETN